MHVHPDIAALRGDEAAQRRIRARMASARSAWQAMPQVEGLAAALSAYGKGAPLAQCLTLERAMTDHASATGLVSIWITELVEALREEPLGEVPNRYRVATGLTSVQLLKSGRATLSLLAYERPVSDPAPPQTALFQDRETHEIVLAGAARGTFHSLDESGWISTSECQWRSGDSIHCPDNRHVRQVVAAKRSMLLLQLVRLPETPRPSREIRLADGKQVHCASGDKAASQRFMALSVLGALDYKPAIDTFEARALDRSEDAEVRWEAVRQALAMEAARGLELLERLKGDASDPLARPATDLFRTLANRGRKAA